MGDAHHPPRPRRLARRLVLGRAAGRARPPRPPVASRRPARPRRLDRCRSATCTATPSTSPTCSRRARATVVLVGHSYGGAVITEAGRRGTRTCAISCTSPRSASTRARACWRCRGALAAGRRRRSARPCARATTARAVLDPTIGVRRALRRLPARQVGGGHRPPVRRSRWPRSSSRSPAPRGRRSRPPTCAARDDRAIPIDHQDVMAAALPHRGRRCETDHSPFLSMPDETADVLEPPGAAS